MENRMTITARELKEIQHALYYEENLGHGTVGHNMLILIARMARNMGFMADEKGQIIQIPNNVKVEG